jgi:hypothetical protein
MPRLTEYLLKLATDAKELARYRKLMCDREKKKSAVVTYLMKQPRPGLTKAQADAVAGNDSHRVIQLVLAELKAESSRPDNPFYGIGITIVVEANNHIHHLTLLE